MCTTSLERAEFGFNCTGEFSHKLMVRLLHCLSTLNVLYVHKHGCKRFIIALVRSSTRKLIKNKNVDVYIYIYLYIYCIYVVLHL